VILVCAAVLVVSVAYALLAGPGAAQAANALDSSPAAVGNLLYGAYAFPFEVVSILLTAAMVGAVVLTRDT
jgi:NADH:ubiquinone oxidoreductase subunit 6 (subunit J)